MRLLRASLLFTVLGVFAGTSLGFASPALAGQPVPVAPAPVAPDRPATAPLAAPAAKTTTSSATPSSTRDRQYAAREAKSPQAAKFKGGEGVGLYIGGSTVAVILFVVLLVVLL